MASSDKNDMKSATLARIQRTEMYAEGVRRAFAKTVNAILALNKTMPTLEDGEMFSFDAQKETMQKKVEALLRQLHSVVTTAIKRGIVLEWDKANEECDKLVQSCFGKEVLSSSTFTAWTNRNENAQQSFINRSEKGLNLSQRIWQNVQQLRDEMEVAMTVAIGEGNSAASMSRKVRQYLNDPDLMFRRFRYKDENGEWKKKWKKRIKDEATGQYRWIDYDKDSYKVGAGVYKSSAKNAMRVTRTETNIAYRRADHERWSQMDFVLGQRVNLSRSHPKKDICDKLAGDYPKDFVFDGWHPQCFCYVTPITLPPEETAHLTKMMLNGEDWRKELKRLVRGREIKSYPSNFVDWVKDNSDKIAASQARGTEPYFIKNNASTIDKILNPDQSPSIAEIAAKRHEERTPEKEKELREYWAKKVAEGEERRKKQSILDKAAARHAARTPEQIDDIKKRAEERQKRIAGERAITHYGERILRYMDGISDIDTASLSKAIQQRDYALVKSEADKLKILGKQILSLSRLDNPMKVARDYSMADAISVNKAVESRLAKESSEPFARKRFLESEIKWVETHKKYSTWKVAQDAYKKELAIVQKKIDVKSVIDSVDDALAFASTSRSKIIKTLADDMRKILSVPNIDISLAKTKAAELNKKYQQLKSKGLKKAKSVASKSIKHESVDDLKKRLGSSMPKTLEHLKDAITKYQKTSKYGDTAKNHKDEIERLMTKLFDEHDLGMNIDDTTLEAVLNSWFKNTFETGSSGGYTGSSKTSGKIEVSHRRLGAAHRLFGLGKDLANDQLSRHEYEKYGNLLDHDIVSSMSHNTATQYGNVEIRFKKDKVIATWTAGDSLSERFQPTLVSDPKSCSFDNLYNTPDNDAIQTHDLAKFKRDHISSYLELQYHGDLTIDCVESLTFPYDLKDPSRSQFLKVAEKWKAAGAKIYYIVSDTLYQL